MNDINPRVAAAVVNALEALDPELKKGALDMARIVCDPSATDEERQMAGTTLDDILFPHRPMDYINAMMDPLPMEHRLRWCEASGACACMGCANKSGLTKKEWQKWGKKQGLELSAWGNTFEGPGVQKMIEGQKYSIRLAKVPQTEKTLGVVRAVRQCLNLPDLVAAAKSVKSAPIVLKTNLSLAEALTIKGEIEKAGGHVEVAREN
jgi:ribosomal protein L7/L12